MKKATFTFLMALPLSAGVCDEIAAKFDPFNEKYQPTAARRQDGPKATIREAILELGTPVRILPHTSGRVLQYDSPGCIGRVFIARDERVWAVAMSPGTQEAQPSNHLAVLQELDRKIADLERQLEALKTSRQTLVTPSSSLTPAEIAFANDDFPNIVNLYTAILDREPRNTTALYRRAYGLQKLGRHVEAVRDYTWYLGLVPEDPKALNNRAASYLATGNRTYAEQDLATLRRLEAKTTPVVAATSETGPGCTSSGSCYGDISTITGRPKTVHVDGYYRKDGTYVRPHYRSTPSRRR